MIIKKLNYQVGVGFILNLENQPSLKLEFLQLNPQGKGLYTFKDLLERVNHLLLNYYYLVLNHA